METLNDTRKVQLVREFVGRGHGEVVRQLLLGVASSPSASGKSEIAYPNEFENWDSKGFHLMTWVHSHLEFTAKYGCVATEARDGKKVYFAHHAEYEEWLRYGAPGVFVEELEACAAKMAGGESHE